MKRKNKSLDSIFLDIMMVLLVVLIIMLASVRVSDNEYQNIETETETELEQEEKYNSGLEAGKQSTELQIDQALIIKYSQSQFEIHFSDQKIQTTNVNEINRITKTLIGTSQPEVIFLVSPELNIEEAIIVMEDVGSTIDWTEPKIGTYN